VESGPIGSRTLDVKSGPVGSRESDMKSGPVGSRVTAAEGADAVERRGLGGVGTSYDRVGADQDRVGTDLDRVGADRELDVGRKVGAGRIGKGFPLQSPPLQISIDSMRRWLWGLGKRGLSRRP